VYANTQTLSTYLLLWELIQFRHDYNNHLCLTDCRRSVIIAHILPKIAVKVETSLTILNPNMVHA